MNISECHKKQITKVCDYLSSNLDDDMSLDMLSRVAACSKFHFHRIFKSFMGLSVIQFVQLSRMKRASFRLVFEPEQSITDIAYEAHFDSPEAFSRAFLRIFEQFPSQFRRRPEWPFWHSKYEFNPPINGDKIMDVNIIDFDERPVALVEHKGNPQKVYETASMFIAWRKSTGLSPIKNSETFGVPYSDPNDTAEEDFRFEICGSHKGVVPENEFGVKTGIIPSGRCALAIHHGSHDSISDTVYYLYQHWLPKSGQNLRDFPCFFQYMNFVHEVNENELITKIYLPLA